MSLAHADGTTRTARAARSIRSFSTFALLLAGALVVSACDDTETFGQPGASGSSGQASGASGSSGQAPGGAAGSAGAGAGGSIAGAGGGGAAGLGGASGAGAGGSTAGASGVAGASGATAGGSSGSAGAAGATLCQQPSDCGDIDTFVCDPATRTCVPGQCTSDTQGCKDPSQLCIQQAAGAAVGACYNQCSPSSYSAQDDCPDGFVCTALGGGLGYCRHAGTAPEGTACTSTPTSTGCHAGDVCATEGTSAVCRGQCDAAATPTGCKDDEVCSGYGLCVGKSGVDPAKPGEPCQSIYHFACGTTDNPYASGICTTGVDEDTALCTQICFLQKDPQGCQDFYSCNYSGSDTLGVCRHNVEVCHNGGVDDDGNGKADCDDPACATEQACLTPLACEAPVAAATSCVAIDNFNVFCNPITNEGCGELDVCGSTQAFDADNKPGPGVAFQCFALNGIPDIAAPPRKGALCDACSTEFVPNMEPRLCGVSLACVGQQCARYCCADADCGSGAHCDTAYMASVFGVASPIGVCLAGAAD